LAKAKTLEHLCVDRTAVTDAGIEQLATTSLTILSIRDTAVTASGLVDAGIQSLSMVTVAKGQFTQEEIDKLESAGVDVMVRDDDDSLR
jgi:hypothetical protein